ncbi:hypothetical protein [Paenibacillus sp. MBLB4367]|uniref:hypothetical protein n=1 Tax=Paenibacillus sp. MBLB4367 TaxID=3384767 RepID=UPI0039083C85
MVTLEVLINEGEVVKRECSQQGMTGVYVTGERYELWIAKSILFLEKYKTSQILKERLLKLQKEQ